MEDQAVIIIALNTAALVLGIILGGGGVLAVLARLNANVQALDGIERIIMDTVDKDLLLKIHSGAQVVELAADTLVKVTDGEPN